MDDHDRDAGRAGEPAAEEREPYVAPALTPLGSLGDLTQGGGGGNSDGFGDGGSIPL